MKKRAYFALISLFLLLSYGVYTLYNAATNTPYAETALSQQQRKLTLLTSRGVIYDRNLIPITNSENTLYAIVPPDLICLESIRESAANELDFNEIIKKGAPVITEVRYRTDNEKILYIESSNRYVKNQPLSNIIGYLNGKIGAAGLEKYGENILNKYSGELNATYTVDSLGNMLQGDGITLDNSLDKKGGIVLTIDKNLQIYTENIGKELCLNNGAIVILSVPDSEILAAASFPLLDSSAPEKYLESENSPFVNKCFSSFAPGSVFKLNIALAALSEDKNIFSPYSFKYNCTGTTYSDGMAFSCFGAYPHGEVDLHLAIEKSCNCFFMNLSKLISPSTLISTSIKLGLTSSTEIFPDYYIEGGKMPYEADLRNNRALSNFAIGQGEVLLSPVKIAAMINTIASRGVYTEPTIYKGETNDGKKVTLEIKSADSIPDFKVSDSLLIENYMASAVNYGTATKGKSDLYKAFAKTGTAQTGKFINDKELLNYWYAGFIETESKNRYVIVVLNAEAKENDNPTGEIFKAIGEFIASNE
ncbi:MAG: hypothetical protein J6M16_03450 [Clostridia bacterium]|nr:hypothetical protein [Clostridia bacterium]